MKYTKTLLEHFRNPRNVGVIEDASGVGKVTSPVCGDIMELYIKVKDERIVDAKFQTFGCAAAIASSSVLTELIKGKTVDEAFEITNKRIVDTLGGLPEEKLHCSVLAEDGVKKAIEDYKLRQKTTAQSHFAPAEQADQRPRTNKKLKSKISKSIFSLLIL